MWVLLSTRLRSWLLLAVAVPVIRAAVRYAASRSARSAPDSTATRLLGRADTTLRRFSRKKGRR